MPNLATGGRVNGNGPRFAMGIVLVSVDGDVDGVQGIDHFFISQGVIGIAVD